jgi:hypothetical protein
MVSIHTYGLNLADTNHLPRRIYGIRVLYSHHHHHHAHHPHWGPDYHPCPGCVVVADQNNHVEEDQSESKWSTQIAWLWTRPQREGQGYNDTLAGSSLSDDSPPQQSAV